MPNAHNYQAQQACYAAPAPPGARIQSRSSRSIRPTRS